MVCKICSTDKGTVFGIPIAKAILLYGFYQLLETLLLGIDAYQMKSTITRKAAIVVGFINCIDGLTSILAVILKSDLFALATFTGYIIDCVGFIVYGFIRCIYLEHDEGFLFTIILLSINIIICFVAIPTAFTLYQLLLFGATGWEKMSPSEFLNATVHKETVEYLSRNETLRDKSDLEEGIDSANIAQYV